MNLSALSNDPAERLRQYQRARAAEEERELIAGLRLKLDAGVELTEREWVCYSYSPLGSAAKSCRCR